MPTRALPVLALLAAGIACKSAQIKPAQNNADLSQVVAKVDDSIITVGDVQERINKQSPFIRARYASADKKKEFLDNLIRFEVMAGEAQRRGYDKDPEVVRVMKQQMISKFLQKDFESKLKVEDVPDADVEKYYKEHPDEYNKKEQIRVSEILVKDKAKADKVYTEAKVPPKPTPGSPMPAMADKLFRDLVNKYSEDDDSKSRGGDLAFFDKDSTQYPKPVVEAAFKLTDIGEVSPPVKTDKGWVVLKLTQKRAGFNKSLPEVKHQIQQRLFRDTRTKALDAFIADLKKKSNVEIHEDNLAKVVIDSSGGEGAPPPPGPGMSDRMPPPGVGAPPPGTPMPRAVVQGNKQ
jgi:peptidyl-prolyl cis-trans isomerase C